jgi:hypothetical protein
MTMRVERMRGKVTPECWIAALYECLDIPVIEV